MDKPLDYGSGDKGSIPFGDIYNILEEVVMLGLVDFKLESVMSWPSLSLMWLRDTDKQRWYDFKESLESELNRVSYRKKYGAEEKYQIWDFVEDSSVSLCVRCDTNELELTCIEFKNIILNTERRILRVICDKLELTYYELKDNDKVRIIL